MKNNEVLVTLVVLLCALSGCANSVVLDLKSELIKGGPAIICDDRKLMYVTFAYPTTAVWTLDINNSVIKHATLGILELVWEQNQYQKEHNALGFKVYREDMKPFEPGHYTFKMVLNKEGVKYTYEGEFHLRYGRAIPVVIN
ncbi:MAG: hypothetical protein KKF80_06630 [Candidatus Omnitrophica bacterium]|nr:hypothetical protein [Candidatus Omnitrophota bacterium]